MPRGKAQSLASSARGKELVISDCEGESLTGADANAVLQLRKEDPPDTYNFMHDQRWLSSPIKMRAEGLYPAATARVCCCGRPYGPGHNRCVVCGTRRPVQTAIDEVKTKMNRTKDHIAEQEMMQNPDVFSRSYAWAAVYSNKKKSEESRRLREEKEWIVANGKFTPQLNERSMAIADAMGTLPIQDRTEDYLYKKNEYLETRRKQVEDAEVCVECTFCPRVHKQSIGMHSRDLRSLYRWDMKRAEKKDTKLKIQLDEEMKNCSFSPDVGPRSRRVASDYCASSPVHARLFADHKRRGFQKEQEEALRQSLTPKNFIEVARRNSESIREIRRPETVRARSSDLTQRIKAKAKNRARSARAAQLGVAGGRRSRSPSRSPSRNEDGSEGRRKSIQLQDASREASLSGSPKRPDRASMSALPPRWNKTPTTTTPRTPVAKNVYTDPGKGARERRSRSASYAVFLEGNQDQPVYKSEKLGGKNIVKLSPHIWELARAARAIG